MEHVPQYAIVSPRHVVSPNSSSDVVEYHVTAFGVSYHLKLERNSRLVSSGCIVETRVNGTKHISSCLKSNPNGSAVDDCFYIGHSVSHKRSLVAVSTCFGLQGVISIAGNDHDLVIKPIKSKHQERARRSAESDNPHIVFRRETKHQLCEGAVEVADRLYKASSPHRAVKRSAGDLHIELLLVADKTMHETYGLDLKNFLLSVTNVANARFSDPSLGRKIYLSVTQVKILESDLPGLEIVPDAGYGLKSFCEWQERENPLLDTDPLHHDAAVLFTRLDLTHGSGGSTNRGLASNGGMCTRSTSCAYVESTGLDTGVTLAHELGHTLGMSHDGDHNNCTNFKNMMASDGAVGPESFKWSPCSRDALNRFISSGKAECLNDHPVHFEDLPHDLPGILYDANDQCRLWMGTKFYHDSSSNDSCGELKCQYPNSNGYKSSGAAMMDGSMCGQRKWCINAVCVDMGAGSPGPVNGGWSAWSPDWSSCSRSCGGGVRSKTRTCDNPRPRFGGKECEGPSVKTNLCNVKSCGTPEDKFKEDQCQATHDQPVDGQLYDWSPADIGGQQECFLLCSSKPGNRILRRMLNGSRDFKDGTVCLGEQTADFYRCVQGKCQAFGCDGHSDSNNKFDKCGVCGGLGNTCAPHSGRVTLGEPHKWSTIVKLPKGSRGVKLQNRNKFTKMTVAVHGKPIFNENPNMQAPSQTYSTEGLTLDYHRASDAALESINIDDPIQTEAEAQVFSIFPDAQFQPDISFDFFTPSFIEALYEWGSTNVKCMAECGNEGYYEVEVTCHKKSDNTVVEDKFCNIFDKPDTTGEKCIAGTGEKCIAGACAPFWQTGEWSYCSSNCGNGTQNRSVECVTKSGGAIVHVPTSQCPANQKPASSRMCNGVMCAANWVTSNWSSCSLPCGRGVQTRDVRCRIGGSDVTDSQCHGSRPESRQACVEKICDPTIVGENCTDISSECGAYDLTMCNDYADWAQINCQFTCSFCSKTACLDMSSDCTGYGSSICEGEYAPWAKENCAKFCQFCDARASVASGKKRTLTSDPQRSVTSSTQGSTCGNKITDCAAYGYGMCSGEYGQWAAANCAEFCGLCGNSQCADASPDCEGYGLSICYGDFEDWSKVNCAKYCGFCNRTSAANGTSVPETPASSCNDASTDCSGYGESICHGDYEDWSKVNCARFCGHCGSPETTTATLASSCKDESTDCSGYGESICHGDYEDWSKVNCARFCGHCGSPETTTATLASSCKDESTDCSGYGESICHGDYEDWSKVNCARFCGHCSSSETTTATLASSCKDESTDCSGYGESICHGDYEDWSKVNCARFCGHCSSVSSPPSCTDISPDCTGYGQSICTGDYTDWAKLNCARFCGHCKIAKPKKVLISKPRVDGALILVLNELFRDLADKTTLTMMQLYHVISWLLCLQVLPVCSASPLAVQQVELNLRSEELVPTENPPDLSTAPADVTTDIPCRDEDINCETFGARICNSPYANWSKTNCAKFCGHCVVPTVPTTPSLTCYDADINCEAFGLRICRSPYANWSQTNCAKFCGFCDLGTEIPLI
ncbi:A disintegrin and metalloproteinase with thrombospondin motifs 1-like [Physella acuta]|uniref:A disintegrin and metalloproteinase with thrombospondin motifs 1-like n=1 Tax=Physella acuta TaxID=109671 RepID=UPI0027DAFD37|nr:A disintegrin and metalloproteinase with thrombospondin motifs 1-like [Physella acuta]